MRPADHRRARRFARKVAATATKPAATNLARAYLALSKRTEDKRFRRHRDRETLLLRRDVLRSGLEKLLVRVDWLLTEVAE
jgi:hypothetical protein